MSLTSAAIPLYSNAPSREGRVGEDSENLPDLRIELASETPFSGAENVQIARQVPATIVNLAETLPAQRDPALR